MIRFNGRELLRVPRHLKPEKPGFVVISIVVLTTNSGNYIDIDALLRSYFWPTTRTRLG
jgi:hypothetical protein